MEPFFCRHRIHLLRRRDNTTVCGDTQGDLHSRRGGQWGRGQLETMPVAARSVGRRDGARGRQPRTRPTAAREISGTNLIRPPSLSTCESRKLTGMGKDASRPRRRVRPARAARQRESSAAVRESVNDCPAHFAPTFSC